MIDPTLTEFEKIRFTDILRQIEAEYPGTQKLELVKKMQESTNIGGAVQTLAQEIQNSLLRRCLTMTPAELMQIDKDSVQPLVDAVFRCRNDTS